MSLLIPVIFPHEDALVDPNIQGLTGFDIVLFGYWPTPDGVDPTVVCRDHAVEAEAELYELAARFSRAGASTDIQLHFGPSGKRMTAVQSLIVEETNADAVVVPKQITLWNNVLVPLRDDRNVGRIVEFLGAFNQERMFALELFHVASEESDIKAAQEMLGGVAQSLLKRGFTGTDLEITVEVATDPETAVVEQATSHNVVVIGETEEQPESDRFFGSAYERIAERTDVPVTVVRSRR